MLRIFYEQTLHQHYAQYAVIDQVYLRLLLLLNYQVYNFQQNQQLTKYYLRQFNHHHIYRKLYFKFCQNIYQNKPYHKQLKGLVLKILSQYLRMEFLELDDLILMNLLILKTLIELKLKHQLYIERHKELAQRVLLIRQVDHLGNGLAFMSGILTQIH